jgi:peptidoglycan/LPS O-acetylase OafA/YrhL
VTTAAARLQTERIEWLDFLRGVAALAVVLFHVRVPLWVGLRVLAADASYPMFDRMLAWLSVPMPFFGTTVMLFFVVSGFAIHWPYSAAATPLSIRPYAVRRFCRIYPPYLVAIALTVLAERTMAALGLGTVSSPDRMFATVGMIQNYVPPIAQMVGNPSLWSLPVEMEFYLLYPALLWAWRRFGTSSAVVVVGLVSAVAGGAVALGHEWAMGSFALYWILWFSGAVLAQQLRDGTLPAWDRRMRVLLTTGVAVALLARGAGFHDAFDHMIWGGIFYLVTLWGLQQRDPLQRINATVKRAGLFLGDISYSLYLVHFPVLLVVGALWVATFGEKPANLLVPIAFSTLPIAVAYLMWRAVERPAQLLGKALAGPAPKAMN